MRYDNVPSKMAYCGDDPWHKQSFADRSVKLPAGLLPTEFFAASAKAFPDGVGLDYEVKMLDIFTAGVTPSGDPWAEEIDGNKAICRVDKDGKPVAIYDVASNRYGLLSPKKMAEFGDALVKACGDSIYMETGGYFGDGRTNWMMLNLQGAAEEIVKGDVIKSYFVISNSYNRTSNLRANLTDVRVVCSNTLAHAIQGAYKIRHIGDMALKVEDIAEQVGLLTQQAKSQADAYREMTEVKIGISDFSDIVKVVYPDEESDLQMQNREALNRIYRTSPTIAGIPGVNGTAWGALNSFTEFIDHEVKARSDDRRFEMALFGQGAEIKNRALEQIRIYMGKAKSGPQTIAI